MSFKAAAWALEQTTKTPLEKLVLIVLADCQNEATGKCFPSLSYLQDKAMCSRQGAINVIASLENQGFISAKKEAGKKTFYSFHMEQTGQLSVPVEETNRSTECTGTGQLSVPVNSVYGSTECTQLVNSVDPTGQLSRPEPRNNQEVTKKHSSIVFPEWLDRELWSEWKKTRHTGKTKFTEQAEKLNLTKLEKLCPGGHRHREVIEQTIANGWKSFFPVDAEPASHRPNRRAL